MARGLLYWGGVRVNRPPNPLTGQAKTMKKFSRTALVPFLLLFGACSGGSGLQEPMPEKGAELSNGKGSF